MVTGEVNTLLVGNATYSLYERRTAPGDGLPPHVHEDQDEAVYVVAGRYVLVVGDDRRTLGPREHAFVPRGTVHALTVPGAKAARSLVVFNPPGAMERFYDEVSATSGQDVLDIARRFGITLLTSPV